MNGLRLRNFESGAIEAGIGGGAGSRRSNRGSSNKGSRRQ